MRGRSSTLDPARVHHITFVEKLLLAAQAGDIEVWASTLVISECLAIDKDDRLGAILQTPACHFSVDGDNITLTPDGALSDSDVAYVADHTDALRQRLMREEVRDAQVARALYA